MALYRNLYLSLSTFHLIGNTVASTDFQLPRWKDDPNPSNNMKMDIVMVRCKLWEHGLLFIRGHCSLEMNNTPG